MPRLTARSGTAPRRRRGLTLTEMVVAMFVLSIVGTALIRVFTKQQQVYKDLSLTAMARRELRMGASVLPTELRSISSAGGDIISMSEQEVHLLAFIGTSVACAIEYSSSKIHIPPRNLAHHKLTSFVVPPEAGDWVFLFDENPETGAQDDEWLKYPINGPSNSSTACPGAPFTDPVLDAPALKPRRSYNLTTSGTGGTIPNTVKVGAVVRFARPVKYRIYQEASGNWYLGMDEYKSGSWTGLTPLAGPYRPFASGDANPSGLQFRFYRKNGARITDMTQTSSVARIDVFLRTNAGPSAIRERGGKLLQDSVVMRVAIRNSQ